MSSGGDVRVRELPLRVVPLAWLSSRLRGSLGGRGSLHLIERNARAYRHVWLVLVSGVAEPLFYLLAIGVGLGQLVGTVAGPGGGRVTYAAFVAPALLATSSMNGAIYDSTFNVFFLLKYAKVYDATLATPMQPQDVALGQVTWALIRGALYALAFTAVVLAMGLFGSYWAVFVLPAERVPAPGRGPGGVHAAVPGGHADPRPVARRGRTRPAVARGLPRGHGPGRPVPGRRPGGPPAAHLSTLRSTRNRG